MNSIYNQIYRNPLSIGIVAKILKVSRKTAQNWASVGELKAYHTMGGHWRVWPRDLFQFIQRTRMDIPFKFVDARGTTLLLVGGMVNGSVSLVNALQQHFPDGTMVLTADDGYQSAYLMGAQQPDVVILSMDVAKVNNPRFFKVLKRYGNGTIKIIVLTNNTHQAQIMLREAKLLTGIEILSHDTSNQTICQTVGELLKAVAE